MLMPELVQIVLPVLIRPRNQHEPRLHLQQRQKAHTLPPSGLSAFQIPPQLFHHSIAYGVEFELLGNPSSRHCRARGLDAEVEEEHAYKEIRNQTFHCLHFFLAPPIGTVASSCLCPQSSPGRGEPPRPAQQENPGIHQVFFRRIRVPVLGIQKSRRRSIMRCPSSAQLIPFGDP